MNPSPSRKLAIAVCGTVPSEVEGVLEILRGSGNFDLLPVRWPDPVALRAAYAAPASAYVVVGASGEACRGLMEQLGDRPQALATPVVAVGGDPALARAATCWFARTPPSGTLEHLFSQLLQAEPAPASHRVRKTDLIIGISPGIKGVHSALDRLAPSRAPVLITGESGTGKELVARALHYTGPRWNQPFLAVNCAALPEHLIESELFGHARGAFTGAVSARPGLFESADGGTVFLDEIGEMPLALQAKLLRVLETGEVTRLGSTEVRRVNARLVTATNRDLEVEVAQKRFREDLYYRVRVFPLHLPPLRERPEDIPLLVAHHIAVICEREGTPIPTLSPAALEKLLGHQWPGNIRELINVLQRALLLAGQGQVDAHHVVLPQAAAPLIAAYHQAKQDFERRYYSQLLRTASGNVSLAAKLSQKTRKEVYDALKRLALDPTKFRDPAAAAE